MILEKEQWKRFVKGYHVVNGAIGFNNSRYCFVLEETKRNIHRDPPSKVRLLFARMERPLATRFYAVDFGYFEFPRVASATIAGIDEFVVADMDGQVIAYNDVVAEIDLETTGIDTDWAEDQSAAVKRLKRVNGKLYALCNDRLILERTGTAQWTEFPGLERPAGLLDDIASKLAFGFADMDAFSATDMYAVGGHGDVWQYNGSQWSPCNWPDTEKLNTVCCTGDGKVYITGNDGTIWMGRDARWEKVPTTRYTIGYNDTVWFAGQLWLANDDGLEILGPNGPQQADVAPAVHRTARRLNLSADGTLLLSAGQHGASLFDGKEWQVLFNSLEFLPKKKK